MRKTKHSYNNVSCCRAGYPFRSIMKLENIAKQVRFVLCGSCYWCASALAGRAIEKCPACSGRLESARVS